MKNFELKNWEKVLIALAMLLFMSSLAAYVTDFPLRNYLFDLEPEEGTEEIGKVVAAGGTLKREMLGQTEFNSISRGAPLFVRDTVVTGDGTNATLQLNDGSTIELGPRTMVKLEYEGHASLLGVTQTTRVEVISGQVTGKAPTTADAATRKRQVVIRTHDEDIVVASNSAPKTVKVSAEKPFIPPPRPVLTVENKSVFSNLVSKFTSAPTKPQLISTDISQPSPVPTTAPVAASSPSPSPAQSQFPSPSPSPSPSPTETVAPWTVQIVSPSQNATFKPEKAAQKLAKTIQLSWRVNLKDRSAKSRMKGDATVSLKLAYLAENGQAKKILFEKTITSAYEKTISLNYALSRPGHYEFEVMGSGHASSSKIRFALDNALEGIELLQPEIIDFNKNQNIKDRGRRIAKVRLSWKPVLSAKTYTLRLYDRSSGTEKIQELNLNDIAYIVSRQSAAQQEMQYEVMTKLQSGFTVRSPKAKFIFDFPPPDPTTPPSRSVITRQDMEAWEGGVLLTWQQTGVSEGYVIEVAKDPKFSKVLVKRSQKDNFFLVHPVKGINHYWWRVSAHARDLVSRPSQVFEFTTTGAGEVKTSTEAGQNQIKDQQPGDQTL